MMMGDDQLSIYYDYVFVFKFLYLLSCFSNLVCGYVTMSWVKIEDWFWSDALLAYCSA